MELSPFQSEALDKILDSYYAGGESALVIMPPGTGKSVLAFHLFKRMASEYEFFYMAYVTPTKTLQSAFQSMVDQVTDSGDRLVKYFLYDELVDKVYNKSLRQNEFQVLVFDDVDSCKQPNFEIIFKYFEGLKVGFTRSELPQRSTNLFSKGIVYKYDLQQSILDGYFLTSFKEYYTHLFGNLYKQINDTKIGSYWSESLQGSFIQQINALQEENIEQQKAISLLLSGNVDIAEILELQHKKEQLSEFDRLLNDDFYFDEKAKQFNGEESVWQLFFEDNPWIFGFGLNYIFNSSLEGQKLEQTVAGYSVAGNGKRTDALLKSSGLIQTLCFGEIKTHRKIILKDSKSPYRSESWAISDELAGGIAQVQRTIQKSLYNISNALAQHDKDGFKLKDPIYLYKPKSFLIIGSLKEFRNDDDNIHEEKFSSFELFRRSISDIEIITFDEIYERANAIVKKKWKKQKPSDQ